MKNKIRRLYNEHHIALFVFIFEVLYQFSVTNSFRLWEVDEITYAYHAVDFSMGFCSKILPGAIYSFIFPKYSYVLMSFWETVLFLIFTAVISILLEKLYLCSDCKNVIKLVLFLALTGPCTLSIFIVEFGMLDVYWFYFAIIAICLISNKRLIPFTLLLAFWIVLVHYSSILCYIPLIILMMLYKSTVSNNKFEKRTLVITAFFFTMVAIASTVYFAFFDTSNLRLSMERFNNVLSSRGAEYHTYYDYSFYRETFGEVSKQLEIINSNNETIANFIGIVLQQIKVRFSFNNTFCVGIVYTIPIVIIEMLYFFFMIKESETSYQKFILFLMSGMFIVTFLGGCMFSTDVLRWYSHAFICLLVSFLFVMYYDKKSSGNQFLNNLINKIPNPIKGSYCLLYSLMIFEIYT